MTAGFLKGVLYTVYRVNFPPPPKKKNRAKPSSSCILAEFRVPPNELERINYNKWKKFAVCARLPSADPGSACHYSLVTRIARPSLRLDNGYKNMQNRTASLWQNNKHFPKATARKIIDRRRGRVGRLAVRWPPRAWWRWSASLSVRPGRV